MINTCISLSACESPGHFSERDVASLYLLTFMGFPFHEFV